MPLKWKRGENPYVRNSFGVLGVGPETPPRQIAGQADKLLKRLNTGMPLELGGQSVDRFLIEEARKYLLDEKLKVGELLLVHPETKSNREQLVGLRAQIHKAANLPRPAGCIPLLHPLAILWFMPTPEPECIPRPDWAELGLVQAGDPEDRDLDIEFDS